MIQIDMEKPNHCLRCPMRGVDDECVLIRGSENFFGWEERYANCPLQEVEPERKRGKWIGKEQFANSPDFYSWQCSVCGCVLEDPTLDKPYPFCPHCGSHNTEEEGEQE